PASTLFPYTTLFRSRSAAGTEVDSPGRSLVAAAGFREAARFVTSTDPCKRITFVALSETMTSNIVPCAVTLALPASTRKASAPRSEEHTSELQSRGH